jgi:hypothetical protein
VRLSFPLGIPESLACMTRIIAKWLKFTNGGRTGNTKRLSERFALRVARIFAWR